MDAVGDDGRKLAGLAARQAAIAAEAEALAEQLAATEAEALRRAAAAIEQAEALQDRAEQQATALGMPTTEQPFGRGRGCGGATASRRRAGGSQHRPGRGHSPAQAGQ